MKIIRIIRIIKKIFRKISYKGTMAANLIKRAEYLQKIKTIEAAHSKTSIGIIKNGGGEYPNSAKFPYSGRVTLSILISAYEKEYKKINNEEEDYFYLYKKTTLSEIKGKIKKYKTVLSDIENNQNIYAEKYGENTTDISLGFRRPISKEKCSILLDFDEYDIPLFSGGVKRLIANEISASNKIKYRPNWVMEIFFRKQNKYIAGYKMSNIWTISVL